RARRCSRRALVLRTSAAHGRAAVTLTGKENVMKEQRSDAEQKLTESMRTWGFDFDTFRSKAKASIEEARGDLSEVTGVLRQTMARTRSILLDLQKSREPVSAELKNGFERAWNEIEQAFARARQLTRESKQVPAEKKDDWQSLG
ncbi:MAG: sll1863 family stress response protein, partial [Thermoanaerobaculia bacterium]